MRILNFGSLNIDKVYSVDHFVRAGETILCTDMNIFCGGKGLNQSGQKCLSSPDRSSSSAPPPAWCTG